MAINLACGPETDPYDYYVTFFHNNLPGNDDYRSFYFNGFTFLNDEDEQVSETTVNAAEWASYLGNGVKAKDVEFAMYDLKHSDDSTLLVNYLKPNGHLPDSLKKNTFLRLLVSGNNRGALQYYRFTKSVESLAAVDIDRWNPRTVDSIGLIKKGIEALTYANKETDIFLKLRYYYQAERLLHFGKQYERAEKIYDEYIAKVHSKSHVMGWALSLKAGEEWRLGSKIKAAYLFSKVFEQYPERREQAYIDYINIKPSPQAVIKLAANNNEKAIICAIAGFQTPRPSLDALKKVYAYKPTSPLVEVLLIREMNKLEESYLSPVLNKAVANKNDPGYYTGDTTIRKYKAYIPALKSFCTKLAVENKCCDNGLGYLALAYLNWMQQKNADGFTAVEHLNALKINPRLEDQKQLIRLLLIAQKIKKLDEVSEQELLPSLKWLDIKVKWEADNVKVSRLDYKYCGDYDLKFYSASSRDFYNLVLAPAYLKQKDTARAALAILKSERTVKPQYNGNEVLGYSLPSFWQHSLHSYTVKTILRWKGDTIKTAYLRRLMSAVNDTDVNGIRDLLGTAYLREHNYKKAINTFKMIDPNQYQKLETSGLTYRYYSDPFLSQLPDYPKLYSTSTSSEYTPLRFAVKMAELEWNVKTDPKKAMDYYYKMATGLYNTSTYGNSYNLISYSWSADDNENTPSDYYDGDYLQCINAEKYYLKARSLSKNKEFKAKCTFMAAKCRQKQYRYPNWNDYNYLNSTLHDKHVDEYYSKLRQNPYFADLKTNFANTSYFKLAVEECSYLRDFLHPVKAVKR